MVFNFFKGSDSDKLFEVVKFNISNNLLINKYLSVEGVGLHDIIKQETFDFPDGKILVIIYPTEKCPKSLLNTVYEIIQNTWTYQED